jgi:glycosyltransferase involved in cell wall biosynthesis
MMPALNEEKNLRSAVNDVFEANKGFNYDISLLIVNDGSTDSTLEIANELAESNKNITVYNNKYTRGLGTAFMIGVILCKGDYYCYVPADGQVPKEFLISLFKKVGEADLILSYFEDMALRHRHRQMLSRLYTRIYNFLFRTNIKYFNGPALFRLPLLKEIDIPTRFYSFHAETVIRFIKHGYSYIEVPCKPHERQHGKSTALKWYNFAGVAMGTLFLFADIYIFRRVRLNVKR